MKGKPGRLTPFGKYVSGVLIDRELSKAQLAALVGTSPQYINNILHGARSGDKYIPAIIAALALDPDKVERITAA